MPVAATHIDILAAATQHTYSYVRNSLKLPLEISYERAQDCPVISQQSLSCLDAHMESQCHKDDRCEREYNIDNDTANGRMRDRHL